MARLCLNIYPPVVLDGLQKKKTEYKEDSKKGVMLEVDLEYPQELHDLQNDYPLAPEQNESNKRDAIPILRINKRKIQYQHRSNRLIDSNPQ